jgi:CRP/FNR family transcriptional regulator
MTKAERDRLIQRYPVLKELPADLLRRVEKEVRLVHAQAGQTLFDEGSPCQNFPLLIEGVIRATKRSLDGHEILLYRLNPGESCVITPAALLGETNYPAAGSADSDLELYGIPRNLFMEMVLKSPAFRVFVFDYLSKRLAHLMALIDDVAFRRLDQRLAGHLLHRREQLTVTHQMLADELGTTREVVSRTLEAFQESGMLKLGRKRIEILDRGALERLHRSHEAQTPSRSD